jgi:hypothetical protein
MLCVMHSAGVRVISVERSLRFHAMRACQSAGDSEYRCTEDALLNSEESDKDVLRHRNEVNSSGEAYL